MVDLTIDYEDLRGREVLYAIDEDDKEPRTLVVEEIDPEVGLTLRNKNSDTYHCCLDLIGVKGHLSPLECEVELFNYYVGCILNGSTVYQEHILAIIKKYDSRLVARYDDIDPDMCVFR